MTMEDDKFVHGRKPEKVTVHPGKGEFDIEREWPKA